MKVHAGRKDLLHALFSAKHQRECSHLPQTATKPAGKLWKWTQRFFTPFLWIMVYNRAHRQVHRIVPFEH